MLKTPLTLYIHIPWCKRKCPYCDFYSYTVEKIPEQEYLAALIADYEQNKPKLNDRSFNSIFIGGGTPSLLSPQIYAQLLNKIAADNIETSMEVNPGTVNLKKLKQLREIGINRLSIGVQSFQNEKLKLLGRIHNSEQAKKAIKMAQDTGFTNINIDLMFGIPEQTIEDAIYDLEQAIALKPTHISWYQLTIESETTFGKKCPPLPDEDTIWKIQQRGQKLLKENNFIQYEISAFSKLNYQCQHNLNYWQFGDYLGIGAGAHSKITTKNNIIRINKDKNFIATEKIIPKQEIIIEFMLNALRLYQPIPTKLFTERTGLNLEDIKTQLNEAQNQQLLTWNDNYITTTTKGKRFLNDLILLF